MDKIDASTMANNLVIQLIESQPNFWPTGALTSTANAQAAASFLAAFRQKLVEELTKQPD